MRARMLLALVAGCSTAAAPTVPTTPTPAPEPEPVASSPCPPAVVETPVGPTGSLLATLLDGKVEVTAISFEIVTADQVLRVSEPLVGGDVRSAPGTYLVLHASGGQRPGEQFLASASDTIARATGAEAGTAEDGSLVAQWRDGDVRHELTVIKTTADVMTEHRCWLGEPAVMTFAQATALHPALDAGWLPATIVNALRDLPVRGGTVENSVDLAPSYLVVVEVDDTWMTTLADQLVAAGMRRAAQGAKLELEGRLDDRDVLLVMEPHRDLTGHVELEIFAESGSPAGDARHDGPRR